MAVKIAPDVRMQFFTAQGAVLNGGKLFAYVAGSTTKQNTYTDSTGNTANANPIVLNSDGRTPNGVWLTSGAAYKFVLAPSTDTDPPVSPIWTEDNVAGINDTSVTQSDEWVASNLTPTYVSATSFTMSGDQTTEFHVGRRLKTTNTAGTVYSTISVSAYAAVTTITVVNDSGTLDAGLSATYYGILRNAHFSVPSLRLKGDLLSLSAAGTLARLAAGTDGYKLTAESGGTPGLIYTAPEAGSNILNGYLDWSVSGNALTIAVKGWDGNDPSTTNPVYALIRSSTAATGIPTIRKITAATSVVVSSGSTLGTRNSTAFRVWAVGFDDAGTFRLGAINCLTTAAGTGAGAVVTILFPLRAWGIASSTAEGGAGAADSAQTFYTGSAVSSKGYSVLGSASWETGLATAGTWSAGPTRIQLHCSGQALPGDEIQRQRNDTGASTTGTTVIPNDDTIPQITEGDQYMTQAITPTSAANVLAITARVESSVGAIGICAAALFQDATANALIAAQADNYAASATTQLSLEYLLLAAGTSSTTLRVRAGPTANTMTFNGRSGGRIYGGVMNSFMEVREVMA